MTGGETGNKSPLAVEMYVLAMRLTWYPASDTVACSYSGHFVMMVSAIAIVFAIVFFVVGLTTAYKGHVPLTVTFAVSCVSAVLSQASINSLTLA